MTGVIGKLLSIYILYALVTGVVVFAWPKRVSEPYIRQSDPSDYYSTEQGSDRAIIFDNPLESGLARLQIIENAKQSLNVAYFSIEKGETPNVFFGALFDAADRGVKVNILLDGIFHGLRGFRRSVIYAISNHPNMRLKFYEKFNPCMPWTVHNRMHDKYIIADNELALIGGRNIGDKYFAPRWYKRAVTNDRDVAIINYHNDNTSAVQQMTGYFYEIWNHRFSKDVHGLTRSLFRKNADREANSMRRKAAMARELHKELFESRLDLRQISVPTNKVTLIHNPLERFSKEPWCWYELVQLTKAARKSVFIQSPYIVPAPKMTKDMISAEEVKNMDITMLTNSAASTPNLIAFSGYQKYRRRLVDIHIKILELQSTDSVHSKALVLDDELVAIGSFNLDPRSAFLSTESMVVIHSRELVEDFGLSVAEYVGDSLLVNKEYAYRTDPKTKELQPGLDKRLLLRGLSLVTRFVDFLL